MSDTPAICFSCGHPKHWHNLGGGPCKEIEIDHCELYDDGARSNCCTAKIVGIGSVCEHCGAATHLTAAEPETPARK